MPRLDTYHIPCRNALEKAGWTITHDPYQLDYEDVDLSIDLGAEFIVAAEKEGEKIAVEIKSFRESSLTYAFHSAAGQYNSYNMILMEVEPDRTLYLAVTVETYEKIFQKGIGRIALRKKLLKLIVFHLQNEEIVSWIN